MEDTDNIAEYILNRFLEEMKKVEQPEHHVKEVLPATSIPVLAALQADRIAVSLGKAYHNKSTPALCSLCMDKLNLD